MASIITRRGFSDELTIDDRRTLRRIVEKHYKFALKMNPTNAELDAIIDSFGPEVQQKMVRRAVNGR